MIVFPKPRVLVTVLGFAIAAFGSTAGGAQTAPATTQKDKDFEHEVVQTDGVNHPREIVSGSQKKKALPAKKKAAPATQKDKDFEHELVQADGVNHPREIVSGKPKTAALPAKSKAPATQKDKDFEHELVQAEGVNHPREVLKK